MKGIDTDVLVRLLTQDGAAQARRVDLLIASARRAGTLLVSVRCGAPP